jgi:protein SCO1
MRISLFIGLLVLVVWGCGTSSPSAKKEPMHLPFLGEPMLIQNDQGGIDTLWPALPPFSLTTHTGDSLTQLDLEGKIRVADFFFTSCPTICPMMSAQMLRIHQRFGSNNQVVLISHSIDPEHDSVPVLADYAQKLGASAPGWFFLTGDMDLIFSLADAYGSFAEKDPNAPGGFAHSGALTLADRQGRIRGVYDGTNPEEVDRLMSDMELLLEEAPGYGPEAVPVGLDYAQ